ncbi:MAG: hypothetical protein KIT80_03780 [Chitinophagaceae bacterium]|nr:hypothetical protein [Chitinophagaceae bacterium]MCW5926008.1 hypothetical protein [Chitinophagaceae bacterium]
MRKYAIGVFLFLSLVTGCGVKTGLDHFVPARSDAYGKSPIRSDFRFNGYTEYWQDIYEQRFRYGNLYRINVPDAGAAILQSKMDLAADLGLPGLMMEEGFVRGLLKDNYALLENPSAGDIERSFDTNTSVLVLLDIASDVAKSLLSRSTNRDIAGELNSYQAGGADYAPVKAFVLKNGDKSLYAVVGGQQQLGRVKELLNITGDVLKEYDLKKGWFGAQTLIKSVTCTPGTPIELVGKGMNEGNSWFVFDGYMEFLAKEEINNWMQEVSLPVVTDVGFSPVYGCEDYDGLQVQSLFTPDAWIDYARRKKGYVFRPVYNHSLDKLEYDGYIAQAGNIDQVNNENKPFILGTGNLKGGVTNSMIIFHQKGEVFTREKLWDGIMNRRAVGVLERGKMMGPAAYRNALQLLLLDRLFLEEYFGDNINMETATNGNRVQLHITNLNDHSADGKLIVRLPGQLTINGDTVIAVNLGANTSKTIDLDINPTPEAMGRPNAVALEYQWGNNLSKSTLALLDLPPAVSVHELLYGHSSGIRFPVTIHNFTGEEALPVKVSVVEMSDTAKSVFDAEKKLEIKKGQFATTNFDIRIPAGNYLVKTTAMGVTAETQLGVEENAGTAVLQEVDLNNDGVNEYQLENDQVKITLLATGARVIEYIVKSKNDNILFKLWPDKPVDDRRPFRVRGFYPYGGFEDFLGQPSIETHKVYDAVVEKKEGEYVQVKMKADYYGNVIEKIFTLYGNSPLLEVRFALTMKNPELSMLGPQPILEIGKAHGPEDKFIIPEMDGLHEYVMKPEKYYGRAFFVNEGWNAGYDTRENISFAGAFPVKQPIFLHMWMNHPSNSDAHYYYAEFQPWTPLFTRTTTYFSYYMWGAGNSWEQSVKALRDRNLVTKR